jgi:hypothetical protein
MIFSGPGKPKRDERRWIDLQKKEESTDSPGKRKNKGINKPAEKRCLAMTDYD